MALPSGRYGLAKDWVDKVTGAFKKDKIIPCMNKSEWHSIKIYNKNNALYINTDLEDVYVANKFIYYPDKFFPCIVIYANGNINDGTKMPYNDLAKSTSGRYYFALNNINDIPEGDYLEIFVLGHFSKSSSEPTLLSNDTVATQSVTSARKVAKAQVVEPTEEETIIDIEQPTDEG